MTNAPIPAAGDESPVDVNRLRVVEVPDDPPAHPQAPQSAPPAAAPTVPVTGRIAILSDVELKVEVVLGRARRTLQELLGISPGQSIELDRQRNSPVEVLVNGKPFALGEIVVIDDSTLGVRVIDVIDGGLTNPGRP